MNKILLIGKGRLAKQVISLCKDYDFICFDENNINELEQYTGNLLLDCSSYKAFPHIYNYLLKNPLPTIICSTNHSKEDEIKINYLSSLIPIIKCENFSLGMNLLFNFFKINSKSLKNYDSYILDVHHKNKKDTPSGTSKKINSLIDNKAIQFSFLSKDTYGKHTIFFNDEYEELTIIHNIKNPLIFAKGILKAINFLKNKKYGMYYFEDIINEN